MSDNVDNGTIYVLIVEDKRTLVHQKFVSAAPYGIVNFGSGPQAKERAETVLKELQRQLPPEHGGYHAAIIELPPVTNLTPKVLNDLVYQLGSNFAEMSWPGVDDK